jgi:hypothetical protein
MRNFMLLAGGIDVLPLALALQIQPELWNQHNERKEFDGTSHAGTSDIWVRYNDPKNLAYGYEKFTQEHDSVWHPAYYKLPQLRPIVFSLMARCEAVRLGGVLITRIPPGGHILPHADKGWHPEYYNVKLYVPIQTNPQCINRVGDEHVVMRTGDCWYFNNLVEHEVINNGNDDRMTLIICLRCDG